MRGRFRLSSGGFGQDKWSRLRASLSFFLVPLWRRVIIFITVFRRFLRPTVWSFPRQRQDHWSRPGGIVSDEKACTVQNRMRLCTSHVTRSQCSEPQFNNEAWWKHSTATIPAPRPARRPFGRHPGTIPAHKLRLVRKYF